MSNRRMSAVRASVVMSLGLVWAGALVAACSNGPSSANSSDAGPQYYNSVASSSTSASTSKGPYEPPMNFIDGQVIVTYPDASPDSGGDGSSEADSTVTDAPAPDSAAPGDAHAAADGSAIDAADATEAGD